ncbi:MAG: SAM-dependent chlorinase/fluorinase [Chromatiales bacterium]|nr:SAM-dependent chlorinase/fluorinase [Chromatiales bacterium]
MDDRKPNSIALFTDFGPQGLYTGQMALVLKEAGVPIINLLSEAPSFNPKASAYLLAAIARFQAEGILFLSVVDPGVGSDRLPLIVRTERHWFVGPDNGLFSQVLREHPEASVEVITWLPERLSVSFHGRDLFAPVANKLCRGDRFSTIALSADQVIGIDWADQLPEVIYIDHYGNLITGVSADQFELSTKVTILGRKVSYARTFSEVNVGELLWYENSIGLVEIAVNQGSAAEQLAAVVGTELKWD